MTTTPHHYTREFSPTLLQYFALRLAGLAIVLLSEDPLRQLWGYRGRLGDLGLYALKQATKSYSSKE